MLWIIHLTTLHLVIFVWDLKSSGNSSLSPSREDPLLFAVAKRFTHATPCTRLFMTKRSNSTTANIYFAPLNTHPAKYSIHSRIGDVCARVNRVESSSAREGKRGYNFRTARRPSRMIYRDAKKFTWDFEGPVFIF